MLELNTKHVEKKKNSFQYRKIFQIRMFLKKLQFHAADGESQLTRESDNLKRGGTKLNLQNDCCIFNNVGMMELVGHV